MNIGRPITLPEAQQRAIQIRRLYDAFNEKHAGHAWSRREVMEGFVGDVGDLMKLVMAKEGTRTIDGNVDEKLEHELSDCLWCVFVLSEMYGIDIEKAFLRTMDDLERRISS